MCVCVGGAVIGGLKEVAYLIKSNIYLEMKMLRNEKPVPFWIY